MEDKEFRDNVYKKYQYYINSKQYNSLKNQDNFFNKKVYRRNNFFILNYVSQFIIIFFSISIILIGGLSTYAYLGGKIEGKPVLEWFGIKFSDEYSNYVEKATDSQTIVKEKTEVNLVSTMCNEGFTVLEFDVQLSEKDKKYLRIDEDILTKEDVDNLRKEIDIMKQENASQDSIERAEKRIEKQIEDSKKMKNSIKLLFVPEPIVNADGTNNYDLENNKSIFIDGEKQWISPGGIQTTDKISEYNYRVFLLFFLTEKNLGNKQDFTITLKNLVLGNGADLSKNNIEKKNMVLVSGANNRKFIELGGEYEIKLSKKKALKDTKIIEEGLPKTSEYRNMTKKVDKVFLTPVQTIIKIDSVIDKLSLRSLQSRSDKNYIGLIKYNICDNDGNQLNSISYETRRIITYDNGTSEEWSPGDIGTYKSFYNGKMNLTEYIIIEKKDNIKGITIQPIVTQPTYNPAGAIEGSTEKLYVDKEVLLDKLEINF